MHLKIEGCNYGKFIPQKQAGRNTMRKITRDVSFERGFETSAMTSLCTVKL